MKTSAAMNKLPAFRSRKKFYIWSLRWVFFVKNYKSSIFRQVKDTGDGALFGARREKLVGTTHPQEKLKRLVLLVTYIISENEGSTRKR